MNKIIRFTELSGWKVLDYENVRMLCILILKLMKEIGFDAYENKILNKMNSGAC